MFRLLFDRRRARKDCRLARELAKVQAENDALRRVNRIQQAEIESLAAVVARDRERVKAEAAAYSRTIAELEGVSNGQTK